jgi:hypothetical protein
MVIFAGGSEVSATFDKVFPGNLSKIVPFFLSLCGEIENVTWDSLGTVMFVSWSHVWSKGTYYFRGDKTMAGGPVVTKGASQLPKTEPETKTRAGGPVVTKGESQSEERERQPSPKKKKTPKASKRKARRQ